MHATQHKSVRPLTLSNVFKGMDTTVSHVFIKLKLFWELVGGSERPCGWLAWGAEGEHADDVCPTPTAAPPCWRIPPRPRLLPLSKGEIEDQIVGCSHAPILSSHTFPCSLCVIAVPGPDQGGDRGPDRGRSRPHLLRLRHPQGRHRRPPLHLPGDQAGGGCSLPSFLSLTMSSCCGSFIALCWGAMLVGGLEAPSNKSNKEGVGLLCGAPLHLPRDRAAGGCCCSALAVLRLGCFSFLLLWHGGGGPQRTAQSARLPSYSMLRIRQLGWVGLGWVAAAAFSSAQFSQLRVAAQRPPPPQPLPAPGTWHHSPSHRWLWATLRSA